MATDFKTAQPAEYYRQFLKQDVRPDGRELGEIRSTILNIGSITTADGSALVKLGNTTVVCGIKAEFTTPKEEEPKKGFVVPNVDLPPLCSSRFKPGPPSEQAQVISQLIADIIDSVRVIDLEELCIEEGKHSFEAMLELAHGAQVCGAGWCLVLCWVLFCDIMCLDYDGNIADASLIALLAALRNMMLPSVFIDTDTGVAVTSDTKTIAINVKKHPVATTFAIFDDTIMLTDPTNEEETMATGMVTIVVNEDHELCHVHKPGGSPLSANQLQVCITRAITRASEVRQLINDTMSSVER